MNICSHKYEMRKELYRNNATVPKNIRLLRLINGLSQEAVSEKLHLSRSAYRALETGDKGMDLTTLINISEFYGVNLDYIVTFDICQQLMEILSLDTTANSTENFMRKYTALSEDGKRQIEADIKRFFSFEGEFRTFPWKYDEGGL